MATVSAVVVTHNRTELLRECLTALLGQTRPPERVLVVNNASTDDTLEVLEQDFGGQVDVLTLPSNEGSAGGFHEGMKEAHAHGAEWLWLMDDDTIPGPDALAELLTAPARVDPLSPAALFVSKALWRDGRMHPMNMPWPARKNQERMVDGAERGLMPLGSATWVSLLVHRRAVDSYGLPAKQFFIWSDDIEYTGRILAREPGYLVPTSTVLHKTDAAHTAMTSPPGRFYFHVRNTLFIIRRPTRSRRDRLVFLWLLVQSSTEYLIRNPSWTGVVAILRGTRDGLLTPQSG
ncbi:MAG: glycosyltransferase family 2 protein [Thermoleophilaceae bacterium]